MHSIPRHWRRLIGVIAGATLCAALAGAQSRVQSERVQKAVDAAMANKQGSAVVLDVESGNLIASYRLDSAARRLAHPGSVIKPLTLLALIESNIVKPTTTLMCRRTTRLGGHNLDCSHVQVDEPIDAVAALAYSCNYFFTRMAERLDADALMRAFEQSGLAARTGLVANEATGVVRRPSSKEGVQLMAVGEDSVEVTPLGLATAYRKLALRARAKESSLKMVVEGMEGASRYGTARLATPQGVSIAGKTGTSASSNGGLTNAWFAGFAPSARPEIVVVVFLEQGSGGADAAPVAGRILEAYR